MKLTLGVLDVPYNLDASKAPRRVAVRRSKGKPIKAISAAPAGGKSTGDVAEILEEKYGIFQHFFEAKKPQIVEALEQSIGDAFMSLVMSAPAQSNSLTAATSDIETLFHQFISGREMDGVVSGVPTKASLMGVNHRFKKPYAKSNPERPSFRDTGLFDASMRAVLEE